MRRLIAVVTLSVLASGCGTRETGAPAPRSPVPVASVAERRAAFAQAYGWFRHGELQRALPIFTTLATSYPELADYHLYFIGVIATRLERAGEAEEALTRVLRDYPQSVKAPAAALELGELLTRSGRFDQARPLLQNALGAPDAPTALGARAALAELDLRRGDTAAAYAGFMTVRRSAIGATLARTAKQRVLALRAQHPELAPAGGERLDEARLLLAEQDYAAAGAAAMQLLERPEGLDPADAARLRADTLYGQGETEAALAALRELADRYPASAAAPAALFRVASILWNRDQDAAALRGFEAFRRRYPHDALAAEAVYAIGRIHQHAGRTAAAIQSFTDLVRHYPQSKTASEARWRIGWLHYLARDWRAAGATFAQLARRTEGRERDAALYWNARTIERAGRSATARALYQRVVDDDQNGYYAMWAQQRLGASSDTLRGQHPLLVHPEPVLVHASAPVEPVPAPSADTFHVRRSDELAATGLSSLARDELAAVERVHGSDPATLRYLVRAYQAVDGFAPALRLARRLDGGADLSPAERERLLYPLAFWETVRREAEAQSVDSLLVVAVMRQESLFDPEARSSADARGLMQLLPATAQRVASTSLVAVADEDLMQPEVNIQLGVRHLRALLGHFRGDPLMAVAAYNAGESAVEKWERQFADMDADEFVESITFRETRDYVKKVVANYRRYQQLYGSP